VPLKQATVASPTPIDPLSDPNSILMHRSVYFDYDRSVIHDSDVPLVEAHGRYLVDHRARTIRIEGNCDERGGREYNLALGQRRADAMRAPMRCASGSGCWGFRLTGWKRLAWVRKSPGTLGTVRPPGRRTAATTSFTAQGVRHGRWRAAGDICDIRDVA
jgi:hypothetical protein